MSGPEPQRTILENLLVAQLADCPFPAILVRGLPSATANLNCPSSVSVYNFLTATQLKDVINQSEIVVCRSGYSTIMDLLPLGKKCIFIPTPGQAEQQYLAEYLASKNYALMAPQQAFSLLLMIDKITNQALARFDPDVNNNGLTDAIEFLITP